MELNILISFLCTREYDIQDSKVFVNFLYNCKCLLTEKTTIKSTVLIPKVPKIWSKILRKVTGHWTGILRTKLSTIFFDCWFYVHKPCKIVLVNREVAIDLSSNQQTRAHVNLRDYLMKWRTFVFHFGWDATKPVFGVSDKARLKPVSSATETS